MSNTGKGHIPQQFRQVVSNPTLDLRGPMDMPPLQTFLVKASELSVAYIKDEKTEEAAKDLKATVETVKMNAKSAAGATEPFGALLVGFLDRGLWKVAADLGAILIEAQAALLGPEDPLTLTSDGQPCIGLLRSRPLARGDRSW